MTEKINAGNSKAGGLRQFGLVALILVGLLLFLFRDAFRPEMTVFSNDGPLGQISSDAADTWASRDGAWLDLNWLGSAGIAAVPSFSNALGLAVGSKLWFSKLYAMYSLLFVGFGAWFCFRQWKFTPLACILGGIAAALNGDFLPTACWGVCAQPIAFGMNYFALGALADTTSPRRWVRLALAGFAVGMGVMEAFDIGGIFSLFVAGFVVFQSFAGEGGKAQKAISAVCRLGIVGVCAGLIAVGALSTLIGTQIQGVGGMAQDAETRARRWDEATTWSFPKRETLDIVIPGLFGLRMSPPPSDGSHYWGAIGRHPSWDRYFKDQSQQPYGPMRYGGGSGYAGALVIVVGLWAVAQSFRKQGSIYSKYQRRMIWFWLGVVVFAVLLAYGRYAPFYQFFYALPYASMIRNPAKFLHVLEWGWIILFGFGADALSRNFMQAIATAPKDWMEQWKTWRAKASVFDRRWFMGSIIALGVLVLGWALYASSAGKLADYLQTVGFNNATLSREIASFSIGRVGWSIVLYAITLALVLLTIAGCFNGKRARTGGIILGVFLTLDLALFAGLGTGSSSTWIVTYNWKDRLEKNPLIEVLGKQAYQHRLTIFPLNPDGLPPDLKQQYSMLRGLYGYEWNQHLFPYYNIQSPDVVQEPRMGSDKMAFMAGLGTAGQLRMWEMTSTDRFLAPAAILSAINQQFDPKLQRFRYLTRFDIVPKPGVTAASTGDQLTTVINPNGQFAVFEFGGALPRAKLYSNWQVATNDPAVLKAWVANLEQLANKGALPGEFYQAVASLPPGDLATVNKLADPNFNAAETVLVSGNSAPPSNLSTNQDSGTVEYVSYSPKRVVLRAKATAPAILLLNDRYNDNWTVKIDGKPTPLFRANFVARGVSVPAGEHTIEFYFSTSAKASQMSFAFIVVGLLLIGFLSVVPKRQPNPSPAPAVAGKAAKK